MNEAAMNTRVHVFVQTVFSFLWDKYLGGKVLGHTGTI